MDSRGGYKHGDKGFDRILGIGIPGLLMKLLSCHGLLKNINSVVILKCPKRMLKYNFSKDLLFWNEMIIFLANFRMMQNKELMQKKQIIQTKS